MGEKGKKQGQIGKIWASEAVSYTHLTLPTKLFVVLQKKPLVPSSPVRVKLSNNRLKKLFDKVINDTGNTKGSRDV